MNLESIIQILEIIIPIAISTTTVIALYALHIIKEINGLFKDIDNKLKEQRSLVKNE